MDPGIVEAVGSRAHSEALRWLEANTVKLTAMTDAAVTRKALDLLATRLDGRPAAPNTIARKRAVFYGALRYAVELRLLDANPIDHVQCTADKSSDQVDRRVVVNPSQATTLLEAVRRIAPDLVAFFACLYYAALRPAEALHLHVDECDLPASGWGLLRLTGSTQHAGTDWADNGEAREDRGLKHRAAAATREVPAAPPLVEILRWHIKEFECSPDARLFRARGHRRGAVSLGTYTRVWRQARTAVIGGADRSPLARHPYDLRHAAVSTWLNPGVPGTQVAEWAGHSVHVLLKVYAKCNDGQDKVARRRIEAALRLARPATSGQSRRRLGHKAIRVDVRRRPPPGKDPIG